MTLIVPIADLPPHEWSQLVRRAVAMSDAPAPWLQSALDLWSTHWAAAPAGVLPSPPARLRRWLAVLAFDSGVEPLLATPMRALPAAVRHLLFAAAGRDIDLRIAPLAEGYALSGQLLGPNGEGHIELAGLAEGNPPVVQHTTSLNELGEFRLDGVAGGRYQLTVRLREDEIVLPPIDIGVAPAGSDP
jgi:hypothetical protein